MWFGLVEMFLLGVLLVLLIATGVVIGLIRSQRRKARERGFPTLGAYLRAVPVTDEEKKDAVDLALKGLVICILGLLFPPFLLVGLFPFFFGARKMVYASMGLGLADDAEQPGA
jgi:hypothetical protein